MSTVVTATIGRTTGSGPARRLREEGQLPGVLYGRGKDPVAVHVTYTELRDALKGQAGLNTIFMLDVDGTQEEVIVRDVQRDPIKRRVIHADFMRVDEKSRITLEIPIVIVGESRKLADAGAIIEQKRHSLQVRVAPTNIPDEIEIDISDLGPDDRISVADVPLPTGVSTRVAKNITIAAPVIPRGFADLEAEEEEAAAELLADAGGEAGDDAEGDADGGEESEGE